MAERPTNPTRPEEPRPAYLPTINYHFTLTHSAALEANQFAFYPNDPFRQAVKSLRTPTHFLTNHADGLRGKKQIGTSLSRVVHAGIILLLLLYFFFTLEHFSTAVVPQTDAYSSAGGEPEFQPESSSTAMLEMGLVTASATDKHKVEAVPKEVPASTTRKTGSSLPAEVQEVSIISKVELPMQKPVLVEEKAKVSDVIAIVEEVVEEMAIKIPELDEPTVVTDFEELAEIAEEKQVEVVLEEQKIIAPLIATESTEELIAEEEPEAVEEEAIVSEEDLVIESLEQIKQSARAEGKLFFLKFGARWCLPCKVMEKTTFQNPELKDYIAEHYLSLNVDVDDFDGFNLKQIYQVKALPTIIVFDSGGEVIKRFEESMSATALLEQLKRYNLPEYRGLSSEPKPAFAQADLRKLNALSAQVKQILDTKLAR